jgi:hypothetical protein
MAHLLRPVLPSLVLTVALLTSGQAPAQTRVETPAGVVTVQTHDDSVEVVVQQGGKRVLLVDESSHQKVVIDAGLFTQKLPGGLSVSTSSFTLKRGDEVVATVTREPAAGQTQSYYYEPVTSYVYDPATNSARPVTRYVLRTYLRPPPAPPAVPESYIPPRAEPPAPSRIPEPARDALPPQTVPPPETRPTPPPAPPPGSTLLPPPLPDAPSRPETPPTANPPAPPPPEAPKPPTSGK